ncbi:hypothetical protein [Rubellicoccus peritrichatus]|uniref:Lipoprotein n=1 Tax=Rubellicoccus peritrichatus TaxID=3080537 RepID=A0AAQ3QRV0_9BACT|nr:hypothetical protein [Puniceicoccus sp. CR14]WOO41663.1 hypothetical protein RZN69_01085 [Puniceicoccus sp. CR14]
MKKIISLLLLSFLWVSCIQSEITPASIDTFVSENPYEVNRRGEPKQLEKLPRFSDVIALFGQPVEFNEIYAIYNSIEPGFHYVFFLNGHGVRDKGIENHYIASIVLTNLSDLDIHVFGYNFVGIQIDDNEYYSSIHLGRFITPEKEVQIEQKFKTKDELTVLLQKFSESTTYNELIETLGLPERHRGIFIYYESEIEGWEYIFRFSHKDPNISKNIFSLPPFSSSRSDLLLDWAFHTDRREWQSLLPEKSFMRVFLDAIEKEMKKGKKIAVSD